MQGLIGERTDFIMDSSGNFKPVKSVQDWRNVVRTLNNGYHGVGEGVLNKLKAPERGLWQAIIESVTVVKFSGNKRIGEKNSRIMVK